MNFLWCVVSSVFAPEFGEMLPEIHNIAVRKTIVIIEYSVVFKLLIYLAEAQNCHLDCLN